MIFDIKFTLRCLLFFIAFIFPVNSIAEKSMMIPDYKVITQNGESVNFYSDLVKDKIVAINFIYTSCKMTCPLLGLKFGKFRSALGNKAGREVHLISISIDPVNDKPEVLKKWAQQFDSGTGWTLITGEKMHIDAIVKSLKSFSVDIDDHKTMVIMGNETKQQWKRLDGLSSANTLLSAISQLI